MREDFTPSGYCAVWRAQAGLPQATSPATCRTCPHYAEGCSAASLGPEWVRVDDVVRPDGSRPAGTLTPDQQRDVQQLLAEVEEPAEEWESPLLRAARRACDATRATAGLPPVDDDTADCRDCPAADHCDL